MKIVETILRNAKSLDLPLVELDVNAYESQLQKRLKLPILIVCYTNHALDQFLEGMLKFTHNLIRVGGQSRSEILQKYNLRGRESLCHAKRSSVSWSVVNARDEIKSIREEINSIGHARKSAEKPLGILSIELLKMVVPDRYQFLIENDEQILTWLLDGNTYESRYYYGK